MQHLINRSNRGSAAGPPDYFWQGRHMPTGPTVFRNKLEIRWCKSVIQFLLGSSKKQLLAP